MRGKQRGCHVSLPNPVAHSVSPVPNSTALFPRNPVRTVVKMQAEARRGAGRARNCTLGLLTPFSPGASGSRALRYSQWTGPVRRLRSRHRTRLVWGLSRSPQPGCPRTEMVLRICHPYCTAADKRWARLGNVAKRVRWDSPLRPNTPEVIREEVTAEGTTNRAIERCSPGHPWPVLQRLAHPQRNHPAHHQTSSRARAENHRPTPGAGQRSQTRTESAARVILCAKTCTPQARLPLDHSAVHDALATSIDR